MGLERLRLSDPPVICEHQASQRLSGACIPFSFFQIAVPKHFCFVGNKGKGKKGFHVCKGKGQLMPGLTNGHAKVRG